MWKYTVIEQSRRITHVWDKASAWSWCRHMPLGGGKLCCCRLQTSSQPRTRWTASNSALCQTLREIWPIFAGPSTPPVLWFVIRNCPHFKHIVLFPKVFDLINRLQANTESPSLGPSPSQSKSPTVTSTPTELRQAFWLAFTDVCARTHAHTEFHGELCLDTGKGTHPCQARCIAPLPVEQTLKRPFTLKSCPGIFTSVIKPPGFISA